MAFAFFLTILLGVTNTYCQEEGDMCAYPKNLTKDKTISREDFLKIQSSKEQRSVYMNLTGECKYNLWNAKFEELLQLSFTNDEKEYIKQYHNFIKENKSGLFVQPSENVLDSFAEFTDKWRETMTNKFKWSEELLYVVLADLGYLSEENLLKLRK